MLAVLEESGIQNVTIDELVARDDAVRRPFEVSITVGVAGQVSGYMFLQAGMASASALAEEISRFFDVPVDEPGTFGPMHRAALAELANQISGRATMYLSDLGVDANITPPTVLTGDQLTMAVADHLEFHDAAVHGPTGDLNLVVGLQES